MTLVANAAEDHNMILQRNEEQLTTVATEGVQFPVLNLCGTETSGRCTSCLGLAVGHGSQKSALSKGRVGVGRVDDWIGRIPTQWRTRARHVGLR